MNSHFCFSMQVVWLSQLIYFKFILSLVWLWSVTQTSERRNKEEKERKKPNSVVYNPNVIQDLHSTIPMEMREIRNFLQLIYSIWYAQFIYMMSFCSGKWLLMLCCLFLSLLQWRQSLLIYSRNRVVNRHSLEMKIYLHILFRSVLHKKSPAICRLSDTFRYSGNTPRNTWLTAYIIQENFWKCSD